ncbi:MAG: translocation/assembly module TamB domain-containing protein [Gammaproteobacteria bacterium]|nr:translocation/assembly module TamB domain-containing protein [Gammaproteobacteria bacterium]
MKRSLRKFAIITLVIPAILLTWLVTTESGLRLAYLQAKSYLPGTLNIDHLEGNLIGPVTATKINYQQDGIVISVDKIILDWRPVALLKSTVDINRLQMTTPVIQLPETDTGKQTVILPSLDLPWHIQLNEVVINNPVLIQDRQTYRVNQIQLSAKALSSQLDIETLNITADTFNFNLKGGLQLSANYLHHLNIHWQIKLPSSAIINGEGELDGDINTSRLSQHLNGALKASINAEINNPLDQLNWQLAMNIDQFDISKLNSRWPDLAGELTLTAKGDPASAIVSGSLKGNYVELNRAIDADFKLELSRQDTDIRITTLDLHSGDARFKAHGLLGETLNLDWSLKVNDLATLYPQAKGQLHANGQISGQADTPKITTSFKGQALALSDISVDLIKGDVALDLFHWQQIDIKLSAQTIKVNNQSIQSLNINTDTHHLNAKIVSDAMTALIELKGDINNSGWQGEIKRVDIHSQEFDNWTLQAPVNIQFSETDLLADTLCWHNHQQARLCASVKKENNVWKSQLQLHKLPLLLFSPWLPPDLKLEGLMEATAELQLQSPNQLLGNAQINLPPGALSYPLLEGERDRWNYQGGTVFITFDEQGLKASTDLVIQNGDKLSLTVELPQAQLLSLNPQQQALIANIKLNIHDLGLIEALFPEIQNLQGEVALNTAVTGTLAQPRFNGQVHLSQGEFQIPRLGLNINQLRIQAQNDGLEKIKLQLEAHSGDGKLTMQGQTTLNKMAGWPTEISINGDQFEVSRIPEARVLVSPDLKIKVQHHSINITGNIHIPYAKLQPKDTTTAVHVSDDAVIIDAKQAVEQKWDIVTRIRLTLGERITYFGFGFEGRFGGSLLLEDEPGQLTRATGELNIAEGRYRAYGQRLDVEQGRLLYTGGPLSNPGLDLQAVRHVNNVTAGLRVKGSLSQPQLELFSIPSMGQTDALSYLLLGRPMETASGEEGAMVAKAALALGLSGGDRLARLLGDRFGLDEMRVESSDSGDQASLVVGRYLSPKLYISYGVGLIEAINTLTVRYQISDKWQLKAESGEHQGADFLYTIER